MLPDAGSGVELSADESEVGMDGEHAARGQRSVYSLMLPLCYSGGGGGGGSNALSSSEQSASSPRKLA